MKKIVLAVGFALVCLSLVGCQGESASEDYGGEVKDSGGQPVPAGKGGAAEVDMDR